MAHKEIPVLIVGGGIVGLSASLFLLHQDVPSLLVERHSGTSIHPRARGTNGRTMEIYREVGLDEKIRMAGEALAPALGWLTGETLVGAENWTVERWQQMQQHNFAFGGKDMGQFSPVSGARCTQDLLEPLLLEAARERGGDLRFYTELVSFEQDEAGVTALIRDRATGAEQTVCAQYMIAADGARAHIREQLGIATNGQGLQGHLLNILFHADLSDLVRGREFSACIIERPERRGLVTSINNTDRWVFHLTYDPAKGETPNDFPPERCVEILHDVLGLPDLEIQILSILPWEAAVRVAETFQEGRIFLAGDAAHQMPPWGGKGANSGIADVHNLAWKLAAVLKGRAAPALLQTYDIERRPVGYASAVESGSISGRGGLPEGDMFVFQAAKKGVTADLAGIFVRVFGFGYEYASQAIIPEKDAATVESGTLDGHPGTRAPHVQVERQGQRISTLDLFGRDFVLLSGSSGAAWCEAAHAVAARSGLNLVAYRVGPDGDVQDTDSEWQARAGIQADGAILVRPDGFVAWRSQTGVPHPERTLEAVIDKILCNK